MTPIAAVASIVGSILLVVGSIVVALLRNSRKSPEQRAAQDTGWSQLTVGMKGFSDDLLRRIQTLEANDTAKTIRIERLEAKLYDLQGLTAWYARRVAQLVAFITAQRLTPPPEEPRPVSQPSPED